MKGILLYATALKNLGSPHCRGIDTQVGLKLLVSCLEMIGLFQEVHSVGSVGINTVRILSAVCTCSCLLMWIGPPGTLRELFFSSAPGCV